MTMSDNSPPQDSLPMELPSMSSAEDFRAKTSASPEKVKALMAAEAAYGRNTLGSFANFDLATSSWRTSQHCLIEGLTEYSETWPRSGTMQSGIAYQLPPLVRLTDETEFGLLPTPTAQQGGGSSRSGDRMDETPTLDGMARKGLLMLPTPSATSYGTSNNGCPGDGRTEYATKGTPSLETMARRGQFPTPTAMDSRRGDYTYDKGDKTKPRPSLVGIARQQFPTPLVSAARQGVNEPDGKRGQTLVGAARGQKWRTPNTSDADGGTRNGEGQNQLCHQVRRQWPSPQASDGERGPDYARANRKGSGADDLTTTVARTTFASPAARDFRSGRGRSENGHTPQLPEQVGGQLNPTWVEWLMNFPLRWTVVKD